MLIEIAEMSVKEGKQDDFVARIRDAIDIYRKLDGCYGMELRKSVENANGYVMLVRWGELDDHLVGFRSSPGFTAFRQMMDGLIEGDVHIQHTSSLGVVFPD